MTVVVRVVPGVCLAGTNSQCSRQLFSIACETAQATQYSCRAVWIQPSSFEGGELALTLRTWATLSQLPDQKDSPGMFDALDPNKRSQEYCPMLVDTGLSSGTLQ